MDRRLRSGLDGFDIVIHNHGLTRLREHDPLAARIADAHHKSGVPAVADPVYLDTLARGVLWATGKLDDDGNPLPAYNRSLDSQ